MARTNGQKAQTAIELAVFGAILIFALGAIVRAGVGRGNQQNSIYRATRMAMTISYDFSDSTDIASRNSASVLVIEDRLSGGSSKFGPIDRAPSIFMGSASHSANIFMPVDFGHTEDLPVFDVFVNGQWFDFSTSAFKTVEVVPDASSVCGGQCNAQIWLDNPDFTNVDRSTVPVVGVGGSFVSRCGPCPELEPSCIGSVTVGNCANCPDAVAVANCTDCSPTSLETYIVPGLFPPQSCAKFYKIVYNHPIIPEWCPASPCGTECPANTALPSPGCNLSADQRFDLDRNDLDANGIDSTVAAANERARFAWQWYQVNGFMETAAAPPAGNLTAPPGSITYSGLLRGEGVALDDDKTEDDETKNVSIDVDEDLHQEFVEGIYHNQSRIIALDVRDAQDGDVDFTFSEDRFPNEIPPGFTRDTNVYTEVRNTGTYLRIEEGNLLGGSGQVIRTASKKDSIDVVERVFKMSNDTGRFCRNGVPVRRVADGQLRVQACGNCFSGARIRQSCFEPSSLLLFVRSNVSGYQGHQWTTDLSGDPDVNITRP